MVDGGSANCCKADTEGIPRKDGGEAGTQQIRVASLVNMSGWTRTGGSCHGRTRSPISFLARPSTSSPRRSKSHLQQQKIAPKKMCLE
jgi:hypothetical protein